MRVLAYRAFLSRFLYGATDHQFLDFPDRARRVQAFRANIDAIHDRMAAEQAIWIFQIIQTLASGMIPGIGNEAIRLQQTGRADEFIRVPPE